LVARLLIEGTQLQRCLHTRSSKELKMLRAKRGIRDGVQGLLLCLSLVMMTNIVSTSAIDLPFLQKKVYTPVIFFKVPPGIVPECDAMEKTIKEVEKETGVRVERVDVARDAKGAALLGLLGGTGEPPLLYHRESRQMVNQNERSRIRALVKGRLVQPVPIKKSGAKRGEAKFLVDEESALEQEELLEEQMMTPLQRKGKQAIRERTEEKGRRKQSAT
jgi:hypothetical protein